MLVLLVLMMEHALGAKDIDSMDSPYESLTSFPKSFRQIHIPKTAGTSTRIELNSRFNLDLQWNEMPYVKRFDPKSFNFVFLREPCKHVYSQFLECKYDTWGRDVTQHTSFPRDSIDEAGMREWVNFFHDDWHPEKGDFNGYNPWNIQTRYLTTDYLTMQDAHYLSPIDLKEPSIAIAWNNLRSLDFVGCVDYYKESMCALNFVLDGTFFEGCVCNEHNATLKRKTHGVPKHSIEDLDETTIAKIHNMTTSDAKLYKRFLKSFFRKILQLEEELNVQIMCRKNKEQIEEYLSQSGGE